MAFPRKTGTPHRSARFAWSELDALLHFHLVDLDDAVDDGVDGESAHGMDVQFARDVFAVREDRVDGKEKFGCNFLVSQSFDDISNDLDRKSVV